MDVGAARHHLRHVDGVMLGRAICNNPYLLAGLDKCLFGMNNIVPSRMQTLHNYMRYMEREVADGERLYAMARHLLGLFHAQRGARAYRRHLTTKAVQASAGMEVIREAVALVNFESSG